MDFSLFFFALGFDLFPGVVQKFSADVTGVEQRKNLLLFTHKTLWIFGTLDLWNCF